MWRRGWCRNPRLYSPQQSHLVDQNSLDCSRGLGSAWEPVDDLADWIPDRGEKSAKRPLRLFAPQPQLVPAGAGVMASSNLGSGDGGTGGGSPYTGPPRPDRSDPATAQERTVSYQPEERYWTDYLRIALPVIGLLLLIGLFWYWASAILIGDGSDDPPAATEAALADVNEMNAASPTVAPTATAAALTPAPGAPLASTPTPSTQQDQAANIARTPATVAETAAANPPQSPPEAAADSPDTRDFPVNTIVVTTEDQVNLRSEPSTESDILTTLPRGASLRITGPFREGGAEGDWWPVEVVDSGQQGFVFEEFLQAQE